MYIRHQYLLPLGNKLYYVAIGPFLNFGIKNCPLEIWVHSPPGNPEIYAFQSEATLLKWCLPWSTHFGSTNSWFIVGFNTVWKYMLPYHHATWPMKAWLPMPGLHQIQVRQSSGTTPFERTHGQSPASSFGLAIPSSFAWSSNPQIYFVESILIDITYYI